MKKLKMLKCIRQITIPASSKDLAVVASGLLSLACSHARIQSRGNLSAGGQSSAESAQVGIPKGFLELKKVTYFRISTQPTDHDFPSPALEVQLKICSSHLCLQDVNAQMSEVGRWKIRGEDRDFMYVSPDVQDQSFFHEAHTSSEGVWFHQTSTQEPSESGRDTSKKASTWSVYLLASRGTPAFKTQSPVKEIGFLVNYRSLEQAMIYNGASPFNPDQLFVTKWYHQRTIDWVIAPSVPTEYLPFVEAAIIAWNAVLPKGLILTTRLARPDEDLSAPDANVVYYQPEMTGANAAASYTFYPATGEIFRASLVIGNPSEKNSFNGLKLQGSVSHEIGHVLGLRHNFKGSLYDKDLINFPAGSSIMDYPDQKNESKRRIGPYDRDAVRWAYGDSFVTTVLPFCTDEMIGIDPLCQQNDPTSSLPIKPLLVEASHILERTLSSSDEAVKFGEGKSPFDRLGPYLRLPGRPFYNESINSDVDRLFRVFLDHVSEGGAKANVVEGARQLLRVIEGAKASGLSESDITKVLPSFSSFNEWRLLQTGK